MIEHGTFELYVKNDHIVLDATGPWNEPTFNRYDKELKELVRQFDGAPWSHIAILRNETLLIPSVEKLLEEQLVWRKTTNFVLDTFVFCNNIAEAISLHQLDLMFKRVGVEYRLAKTVKEAVDRDLLCSGCLDIIGDNYEGNWAVDG